MRRAILVLGFLSAGLSTKANDIYIAQDGFGGGTACSDPQNVAYFNNASNWGSGKPIIPGTTLHLCGIFTATAGQQLLTVQGSGANGNPITIQFESGAVLQAPYWPALGAINENGKSYITIDGGSNGLIKNTDNGTTRGYQQGNTKAIYAPNCTGCAVKNLTIVDLYVRTSTSDLAPGTTASQIACVYFHLANSFTIDNVTCHDAGWAFSGDGNNLTVKNSNVYNVDYGVVSGATGTMSGFSIHDNHIHDYTNWDSPTDSCGVNNACYHHGGVHVFGNNGIASNGVIYNNLFDGDPGINITAHVYLEYSVQNVAVFNNVVLVPSNRTFHAIEFFQHGAAYSPKDNAAYNNFIRAGGRSAGSALYARGQSSFTAINNVLIGGVYDIGVTEGSSLSSTGIDSELYDDLRADFGGFNNFKWQNSSIGDLQPWQAACLCDENSLLVPASQINADSSGHLLPGSQGIGLGANLTGLATGMLAPLAQDKNGVARPTSGPWDVGAYVH